MLAWLTGRAPRVLPAPLDAGPVLLRPATLGDWSAWSRLRGESRAFLTPWEPTWPADSLEEDSFRRRLKRHRREWQEDESYNFLSFVRGKTGQEGPLAGGLALSAVRRGVAQSALLGYWVGKCFARRGYTLAAVRCAIDFAFDDLKLHRLEASCLPANQPSRALLERLGFQCEGMARGFLRIEGRWQDHLIYGLLAEDRVAVARFRKIMGPG